MSDMGTQMEALDDFVAKARSQNGRFHESHISSLNTMTDNVRKSRSTAQGQLDGFTQRVGQLREDVDTHTQDLEQSTAPLQEEIRQPLSDMRSNIQGRPMKAYVPTGVTPQKRRYEYPSEMPQTESHDGLRSRHRTSKQFTALPFNEEEDRKSPVASPEPSPAKPFVYHDTAGQVGTHSVPSSSAPPSNTGLREVDLNVARPVACDEDASAASSNPETPALIQSLDLDDTPEKEELEQPARKRRRSNSHMVESKVPQKMPKKMSNMMEGRENQIPAGRRFRNRGSD
jgi:kinesin family protein 11